MSLAQRGSHAIMAGGLEPRDKGEGERVDAELSAALASPFRDEVEFFATLCGMKIPRTFRPARAPASCGKSTPTTSYGAGSSGPAPCCLSASL
jgi:hypothetical protein